MWGGLPRQSWPYEQCELQIGRSSLDSLFLASGIRLMSLLTLLCMDTWIFGFCDQGGLCSDIVFALLGFGCKDEGQRRVKRAQCRQCMGRNIILLVTKYIHYLHYR